MNKKTMQRTLLVAILGLSVTGLAMLVPAAGFAEDGDSAEAPLLQRRGPQARGPGGPPGHAPAGILRALQRLDLDDAQKASIRAILEAGRESGEPLRKEVHDRLLALRDLYQDEAAGDRALENAIDALVAARKALHEHRVSIKDEVREVLSARQQAQLILMSERSKRRGPGGPAAHPRRRGPGPR